jgi:hypothetical protein
MRAAPVSIWVVSILAAAACGGGKPTPPTVGNVAAPPSAPAWTVDQVFETVDPDAALVIFSDFDALKANDLIAGLGDELEKLFANVHAPCEGSSISGQLVATVSMRTSYEFMVWGLHTATEDWLDCLRDNAKAKGQTITVDGDYLTTTTDKFAMSYLVLDHETIVFAAAPQTISRDDMVARTKPRQGGAGIPEMQALRATGAPVWAAARGASPLFHVLPFKFGGGRLTVDVTDHIALDASVAITTPGVAASLAQKIQQQGQLAVQMGFVSALDAHDAADALVVHAELTRASIDKLLSMMTSMSGMGIAAPPGPPPVP